MKMNRKTRIIGLSAILAVLLVGVGVLTWQLLVQKDDADKKSETEPVVSEKIYTETRLNEDSEVGIGTLIDYSGGFAICSGTNIVDAETGSVVCALPQEWIDKWTYGLQKFAFDSAGNLYTTSYTLDMGIVVLKHYSDGASPNEEIFPEGLNAKALTKSSGELFMDIRKFMVDDNYLYLHMAMGDVKHGLKVFDRSGKNYANYDDVADFDLDKAGGIFTVPEHQFVIYKYDGATNKEIYCAKGTKEDGAFKFEFIDVQASDGLIYVGTNSSVQILNGSDGRFVKTAMVHTDSAPSLTLIRQSMRAADDGTIYYTTYVDRAQVLLKYSLEDNIRKEMPYTLSISSAYQNPFFKKMITLFEIENPDQKVDYKYKYNSEGDFFSNRIADGYDEKENVRRITGELEDIIVTDTEQEDMHVLMSTDIFADLTKLIKEDPSYKDLDKKVLDGMTIDGKIRGLPIANSYFHADIDLEMCQEMGIELDWKNATWSEILGLIDEFEGTDNYLFAPFGDTQRIFVRMLISNMPDLIDRDGNKVDLKQPWFIDLIEQWKQASKSPNFAKSVDSTQHVKAALISIEGRTVDTLEVDLMHRYSMYNTTGTQKSMVVPLFAGEKNTNRTVGSSQVCSITQNSKNKENAWKFLSFLVNKDALQKMNMRERSLNVEARRQEQESVKYQFIDDDAKAQYIKEINKVYNAVDYMYDMNYMKEDLRDPLLEYLSGQLTLDEALKQAEHDIWIRLNE